MLSPSAVSFFVQRLIENPKTEAEIRYNDFVQQNASETLLNIIKKQFQLVYFGQFTYADLDELTLSEFNALYEILLEQKNEEKKAREEALRKQKERANQQKAKARRRHN